MNNPTQYKCANCGENGHATGNRNCPKFDEQRKKFIASNEINKYRFFPTAEDSSTWEVIDEERMFVGRNIDREHSALEGDGGGLQRWVSSFSNEEEIIWADEVEREYRVMRRGGKTEAGVAQAMLTGWVTSQPKKRSNNELTKR